MIDLEPKEIQLILDSLNIITIKGGDAQFVAQLQLSLTGYLENKLQELNLEKAPVEKSTTGNDLLKQMQK
tara:strand:+ start:238 stop:447 length:210 start_codon:yes stop_codon:yes gene_type:complete